MIRTVENKARRRVVTYRGVPLNQPNRTIYEDVSDAARVSVAGLLESGTWATTTFDIKAVIPGGTRSLPDGNQLDAATKYVIIDREAGSTTMSAALTGVSELAIVAPSSAAESGVISITITIDLEK